jgi:hypothetical protein
MWTGMYEEYNPQVLKAYKSRSKVMDLLEKTEKFRYQNDINTFLKEEFGNKIPEIDDYDFRNKYFGFYHKEVEFEE